MTATPSPSTRADSQQTKARTAGPWRFNPNNLGQHAHGGLYWAIETPGDDAAGIYVNCTLNQRVSTSATDFDAESVANAAFIVQACNAHDDLVAALEDSWKLIAELEDAVDKGLKLLPHDTARITACCEAARAALLLANPKPSGAET